MIPAWTPAFHAGDGISIRRIELFIRTRSHFKWLLWIALALLIGGCQPDPTPRNLLEKAHDRWIDGHSHSAVELFRAVLEVSPQGPFAEEALFRLGEIHYFDLDEHEKALNYFHDVVKRNPKGPLVYESRKYIAEIVELNIKDLDQAIIEYQNLINHNERPEENPEHQFRIASIFFKKHNYDQALMELEILLENYPRSEWAERAYFRMMEILFSMKKCDEARTRYAQFQNTFPHSDFEGDMEFIMASCLEEEGELDLAHERFKALEGSYRYPALIKMKLEGLEQRIKKGGRSKRKIHRSRRKN